MDVKKRLSNPMVVNFLSLVVLQGVNYLLPLLSFPFLFRVLGVERWGLVSFGYSLMQYFVIFTDFGFNLSGTKYISMNKGDLKKVNQYLNSAMIGRLFLCLASFLFLILLIFCFDKFRQDATFYLLYFGVVVGNVMFPMWFFQGMENMKYITVFNMVAKSLSFLPFFIFIREPNHYIYAPVFYSIGYISAGVISLYFVYKKMKMKWFFPSFQMVRLALKDSRAYFLSRASLSLFTTSNTFILGLIFGNTMVGYYSAAEKLYQAYNQLLTPFSGVLFPHISKTRDISFFKKVFKRVSTLNVLIVILVLALSSFIINIVYGTSAQETLYVFRILISGCLFTIPSMLLGYPFLAAMGHPNFTNFTVMLTSLIHVAGLLLLFVSGTLSIFTVAAMVVFTETSLFCFRIWGVKRFALFESKDA